MDTGYSDCLTDEMIDQCDQIRSIANKSWLSSATISMAQLDNVKAKVYNVGLIDPRDLKATNLSSKKRTTELTAEHQGSSLADRNSTAWGSNNSIPDLLNQQFKSVAKPPRPASAKSSGKWTRPPSGKKSRPQSAKEPIQVPYSVTEVEVEPRQAFGVKGAKYDPNGRPPKGISCSSSVGWVGPPAGLKYPDKPANGNSWTINFAMDGEEKEEMSMEEEVSSDIPNPPHTTPIPPTPEPELEKTKRVFELYIGDPYKEDDFIQSDSEEEEFGPSYTASKITSSTPSTSHPIGSSDSHHGTLRLDLPKTEDDFDEIDEVDTERLLAEAEAVTQNLDLKGIISANKHVTPSTTSHVTTSPDQSTKQNRDTGDRIKATSQIKACDQEEFNPSCKAMAEKLVSQIIDENGLEFTKPDTFKGKSETRPLSSVKFSEDVKTVSITPRNIGRKVDEMHNGKKKLISNHRDSDFVDLIEIRNRIEPVSSKPKADLDSKMAPHAPLNSCPMSRSSSKPPAGIVKPPTRKTSSIKPQTNDRLEPHVSTALSKPAVASNLNRPKSAPLNRALKAVTTVTVDYGEAERKFSEKSKRKKGSDDVETVMEVINRKTKVEHRFNKNTRNVNDEDSVEDLNNNNIDGNLLSTVVKSEPVKNYYEISRHSSLSNYSFKDETEESPDANKHLTNTSVPVIKTTKTLEFDEIKPKEVTIKSVIDQQTLSTKEKENFISSLHMKEESKLRSRVRPSSAKHSEPKPVTDEERPGSRRGFIPLSPAKHLDKKAEQKIKKHSRPSSAPAQKPKDKDTDKLDRDNVGADKTEASQHVQDEREKVIDNLLERTKTLLEHADKKLESDKSEMLVTKSVRPSSAHVGLGARTKDQRRVKSAFTKRPVSNTCQKQKHYASYSQGSTSVKPKRQSAKTKTKVVLTEPCIINTNTSFYEDETEEDLACKDLQKTLADKGVSIAAETLQRALYPPTGKTKHYQITADLPRRTSLSLLSHPKVWLPQEYKNLQQAEKTLSRANEIMYLQRKAEARRAKLEAMGPEERKKMKKKGKKGTKKLRKSQSLG